MFIICCSVHCVWRAFMPYDDLTQTHFLCFMPSQSIQNICTNVLTYSRALIPSKKSANKRKQNTYALKGGIFCGIFSAFSATHFIFCHFLHQIQAYYTQFVYSQRDVYLRLFSSFAMFRWLFAEILCREPFYPS